MKVYLAAMFGQKMEMREVRTRLENAGHEVTSQWVYVEEGVDSGASEAKLREYAQMDLNDVLRSDVLVAFSQPRGTPHTGGGRHVEFGYALSEGIDVVICGPKGEHIFHYLEGVHHAENEEALMLTLAHMQKGVDDFNALVTS